jgi:hypothetical protein
VLPSAGAPGQLSIKRKLFFFVNKKEAKKTLIRLEYAGGEDGATR